MKRHIVIFVALALLLPALAAAQTAQPRVIECPPSQIPPGNAHYQRWNADRVAVHPVIPALYGGDPIMVQRYLSGPTAQDTGETRANLVRGHTRLMALLAMEVFTPQGTDIGNVLRTPPPDFLEDLKLATARTENLHYKVIPCGETVLNYLSWAADDQIVDGMPVPQVMADAGPWLLNWCEEGVRTPEGLCGVRVVDTDPVLVKSGPNAGNTLTVRIYLVCGNPDAILAPKLTVDQYPPVRPDNPTPPSPPPLVVTPPPAPPPAPPLIITVPPAPPIVARQETPDKGWNWPCTGRISRWVCLAGAAAVPFFFIQRNGTVFTEQPPLKGPPNGPAGPGGRP